MKNIHLLLHSQTLPWQLVGGIALALLWLCCIFVASSDLIATAPVFLPTLIIIVANGFLLILLIPVAITVQKRTALAKKRIRQILPLACKKIS
ncbi:MAG: hypothetical protein V4714_23150 [Bacteroidota bacterium]